jgi:hypothetical protein
VHACVHAYLSGVSFAISICRVGIPEGLGVRAFIG